MRGTGYGSTCGDVKKIIDKEKKRVDKAARAAEVIHTIPGTRNYKLAMAKVFVITKGLYGWILKTPPKYLQGVLDKAVTKASRTSHVINGELRGLMDGGEHSLQSTVA